MLAASPLLKSLVSGNNFLSDNRLAFLIASLRLLYVLLCSHDRSTDRGLVVINVSLRATWHAAPAKVDLQAWYATTHRKFIID